MKNWLYICLIGIVLFSACKNVEEQKGTNASNATATTDTPSWNLPTWAQSANIYEVNLRQYTPEGTFNAFASHLPRLKDMGVDILWLMPINPISEKNRKAKGDLMTSDIEDAEERKKYFGSPYSVADYKKVNPHYGTMQDFKNLVNAIHNSGMKVIIDWVPNHTGWDNPWITDHPEWYTQDADGNIIDPIDPGTGKSWGWTDVADLNYDNKEMRQEMISSMQFWLKEQDIDGFRVDVAHSIPQDFWDECSPALMSAKSDIFLLAESERESNRNNKTYHADYGWTFHHLLNDIAKGEKSASDVDAYLKADEAKYTSGFHIHFTSNHDENTWAGTVFDRMGDAHKCLAALTCTMDGMPLIYGGQEEPMKHRLKFFEKDDIGFGDYAYADFYKKLLALKHSNKALWNGEHGGKLTKLLDHDKVFAFERHKDDDTFVGVFNLSNAQQSIKVPKAISMMNKETDSPAGWKLNMTLVLEPWEYFVLSNK